MWVIVVVVAGWVAICGGLVAAVAVATRKPWPDPGGWTVAELAALRGETPLAAELERLPFEEELEAPDRARAWGRAEYESLMSWWEARQ